MDRPHAALWLVPMVALGAALLDMPYGYYQLLRLLICGVAAYLAWWSHARGRAGWAWALGGLAVLYNPLVKIALGRELWEPVNVATIVLLAVHWFAVRREG